MNTELKNKISTFRDLLDLPPCVGSASVNEVFQSFLKFNLLLATENIDECNGFNILSCSTAADMDSEGSLQIVS